MHTPFITPEAQAVLDQDPVAVQYLSEVLDVVVAKGMLPCFGRPGASRSETKLLVMLNRIIERRLELLGWSSQVALGQVRNSHDLRLKKSRFKGNDAKRLDFARILPDGRCYIGETEVANHARVDVDINKFGLLRNCKNVALMLWAVVTKETSGPGHASFEDAVTAAQGSGLPLVVIPIQDNGGQWVDLASVPGVHSRSILGMKGAQPAQIEIAHQLVAGVAPADIKISQGGLLSIKKAHLDRRSELARLSCEARALVATGCPELSAFVAALGRELHAMTQSGLAIPAANSLQSLLLQGELFPEAVEADLPDVPADEEADTLALME